MRNPKCKKNLKKIKKIKKKLKKFFYCRDKEAIFNTKPKITGFYLTNS